jgi:hypothetical protein
LGRNKDYLILCGEVNKGLYIYGKDWGLVVSRILIRLLNFKIVFQYKDMKEVLGNQK